MLWLTELLFRLRTAEWFLIIKNLSWVFKLPDELNFFSHFEQLNGFSSVWILSCVFKCCDWLNFFAHFAEWFLATVDSFVSLQIMFTLRTAEWFISVWIFSCELLFKLWSAEFFSSVRIISRVFKCCDWLILFSHFEQLNGFSSVWIISRFFKCCDCQIHDVIKIVSCTHTWGQLHF